MTVNGVYDCNYGILIWKDCKGRTHSGGDPPVCVRDRDRELSSMLWPRIDGRWTSAWVGPGSLFRSAFRYPPPHAVKSSTLLSINLVDIIIDVASLLASRFSGKSDKLIVIVVSGFFILGVQVYKIRLRMIRRVSGK